MVLSKSPRLENHPNARSDLDEDLLGGQMEAGFGLAGIYGDIIVRVERRIL